MKLYIMQYHDLKLNQSVAKKTKHIGLTVVSCFKKNQVVTYLFANEQLKYSNLAIATHLTRHSKNTCYS